MKIRCKICRTAVLLVICAILVSGVPAEGRAENEKPESRSKLGSIIMDLSALNGTWECLYRSEGGYIQDSTLRITISNANAFFPDLRPGDRTITVTHNLNELWQELSGQVEVRFESGAFPLRETEDSTYTAYEVEIPVTGFLSDRNAVIRITAEGELTYCDPDMKETCLIRLGEPEEKELLPAEQETQTRD